MTNMLMKLYFLVLISLCIPALAQSDNTNNCEIGTCEDEAPYVLKILTSGEAEPRSSNSNEEGQQDNRRADVTLTRKVPVSKAPEERRKVNLSSGGAVWLSKDPTSLEKILSVEAPNAVPLDPESDNTTVGFDVQSNYSAFIDGLRLTIWEEGATQLSEPVVEKKLDAALGRQSFDWTFDPGDFNVESGTVLLYAIVATDSEGRIDSTERRELRFVNENDERAITLEIPNLSIERDSDNDDVEYSTLARDAIPLLGSKVRIFGQDLIPDSRVSVNKQLIDVGKDGRFGLEIILPSGRHEFEVQAVVDDTETSLQTLVVELDSGYFFMVGLADVTVGENSVSGSLESLAADEHHFGGDIFVDGRLAFYLKGKVKGKYLVTAQMDTGTEDIEHLFDDFQRKDPNSIFRRIDPDQYYPVYGDDSTIVDDTDSQGKLYVRVEWDRSRAIWGNFNTNFTGNEFAPFNRSLYGAQLIHKSTKDTELGDPSHSVSAFASKAQSLFRHNEFLGTGGSLYYLRDTDIVTGSEKVWVEVRQTDTDRVVEKIILEPGRDYDIDNFQGRIILRRPLLSVTAQSGPSIIRDEPLAGNETYLVVDYEYSPSNLDFNDTSAGVRAKKWVTDYVGVGGTWAHENRQGDNYDLKGVDLTLKKSDETYIKGEFAQSESNQTSGNFLSDDGGLSFTPAIQSFGVSKGKAFGIEARLSLADFRPQSPQFEVGLWTKSIAEGFSTANTNVSADTTELGFELVTRPSDKYVFSARASNVRRKSESEETTVSGQIDYLWTERTTVSGELRNTNEKNVRLDTEGLSIVAAGKIDVDVNDNFSVYGAHQRSLKATGTQVSNNSITVGSRYLLNDIVNVNGEISIGDKGNSALFGTEAQFSDTYSLYTNYSYSLDNERVRKNAIVIGQRKTLSSQLKVFTEHQFTDDDSRYGYAHTVGLDQKLSKHASIGVSIQRAIVESEDSVRIKRDSISTGIKYQKDHTRASSKIEYRWDEGAGVDKQQWVTTNRFDYRQSEATRWQAKLNASETVDAEADENARFIEAGVGFAHRPVYNDRLNLLGRLTYLSDLQPLSQSTDTDERSFITSAEGLYDITRVWSAGAKLAFRSSEIRLDRNEGRWVNNDAGLVSARVRYKVRFGIDATAAYHWLSSSNSNGTKQGALFTIGRRVGDNLTFSVGYNFTSFDDDLRDDSYDVRGWFVNLIGTY